MQNTVKISSKKIVAYYFDPDALKKDDKKKYNIENLSRGKKNGFISRKTKTRITEILTNTSESIAWWKKEYLNTTQATQFQPCFITLTIPTKQKHDDKYIRRHLLNAFILNLQSKNLLPAYFYCTEKQKNGNIHFHIFSFTKIHWQEVRKVWNGLLIKHDYMKDYTEKFSKMSLKDYYNSRKHEKNSNQQKITKAYIEGVASKWQNPNSTDVKNINQIKNIISYCIKYLVKSRVSDSQKLDGRLWGCSDNIKNNRTHALEFSEQIKECLECIDDSFKTWEIEQEGIKVVCYNRSIIEALPPEIQVYIRTVQNRIAVKIFEDWVLKNRAATRQRRTVNGAVT
jgi:hypothetical protein